ncbi:hybrid sensor histidine kinase/response regulator transcription factor [Spirosoma sp. KUDC1026]|uniref:hybrid sensor histidine kinase/response regulator transcription factor n=1 Tax=Spirosoma sp. KUDC1026 TaxID=2745947 RepID=UPI00159BA9F0|nr:hybrid sensor histidine kinase/response regulator transcription factor [Spirosoma sp. KUDC1026]QKZ13513.1 response regulator [Spirosoma sp. KUDC1026]
MNRAFFRIIGRFLLGMLPLLAYGQHKPEEYRFEHITVNEGLSHSDVMCSVEDKAGFVWIGTNNGIDRYDGYELKNYQMPVNPLNGLSGNRIRSMLLDRKGRLWVGAESAGLSLFDAGHGRFVTSSQQAKSTADQKLVQLLAQTDVTSLTVDRRGRIWAGTPSRGAFVLTIDEQGWLVRIVQIQFPYTPERSWRVTDLVADGEGKIWIATLGDGLYYVDEPTNETLLPRVIRTSVRASAILALHLDRRGDLWIGTDKNIFWVDKANRRTARQLDAHPLPKEYEDIECLYLDSFGQLWVGTNFGLSLWEANPLGSRNAAGTVLPVRVDNPRTFLPLDNSPFSINSGRIHQIFESRFGILWLAASAGGLNKVDLHRKPFGILRRQLSQIPTLPNNYINAILKDETSNTLWIGTRNGFSGYNLTNGTYRNFLNRPLPGNATGIDVSTFCQASDGTLWVGTRYNGLALFRNGRIQNYVRLPGSTSIERIVEDRFGTIWVATFELGLLRFDQQGKLLHQFRAPELPTRQFTFLLYDKASDLLWASTKGAGVLKLRVTPTSLQLLRQFTYDPENAHSLSVNYAWPLLKDRRGALWIGTIGGGLNQLTTNAQGQDVIRRYSDVVPQSNVESLLEDEQGKLWMGGDGLVRFDPVSRQLLRYNEADGLQSNSFKIGAAYRSNDGTLYFGGINGVTYFRPRLLVPNPYPPLVRFTDLQVFNKPIRIGETVDGRVLLEKPLDQLDRLVIKAEEKDFSIGFVGLNYINPQKHTYAYRLIGYNDAWIYPAKGQRTASFANLPPGDYTLIVKASNGEGKWGLAPATLTIAVLPPWWRTWWAYLLYAAALAGALLLYRRITAQQQALKNKLALEQYKVETEKEVTDARLRFFTNVSHELRTPLTLILGPMEELAGTAAPPHGFRDKIMLMHQQTRKLLNLVNQLLDFRKVESGHVSLHASRENVLPFLTEIFLLFKLKAEECRIDYALEAPRAPIMLYFDRSKLEIILTNLMSNAFKYTPEGGKINLLVAVVGSTDQPAQRTENKLVDNYLQIVVRDWGVGMEASELDRIFDPYYQASHTDTLRMMGTGIGLSLVKQFVEAHTGEIIVQSDAGLGTTFTVRLPFGHAHLTPAQIREEALLEAPVVDGGTEPTPVVDEPDLPLTAEFSPGPMGRLLLVEDNDELRQYLQELFTSTYEVAVAVDGVEGWQKTQEMLPDLVISDVMMPRSDGLELCKKIKEHPKTLHIPVVLLTARVAAVQEVEGLESGADEYMVKPFNPRILYAKIGSMLQSRSRLKEYYHRQILLEPTQVVIPDEERQLLDKAMNLVEQNLTNPEFSVPVLVREMGMSQSTFYRQLKAITGQSVIEFIRDVRMKRAAQLLADSHLRVSEIAEQVGIDDLKYFRKTFQSVYTVSPSEYARQHRTSAKSVEEIQDML